MSCVAVQNLVYGCRNIPLSTVTNIEAPLTRYIQQTQQFSDLTRQPLEGPQSALFQAALIE